MKFAHLSDIHLGFQKSESLQKIEQGVFENAMNRCISLKVDFILIPGDMFHVNIPEMRVQKYAFAMFRRVHEAGIPVYVVYGSHDFSPVTNSVIDLLVETGYLTKVTQAISNEDGSISLEFLVDEKTGAKITGLSGLKVGKDIEWYEKLERMSLENESGFKIFLFHAGIVDMKKDSVIEGDQMPLSLLPREFDYYAGGHMHKFNHQNFDGYQNVVYPGTPFAGYHADLEENAAGLKRGFVLVDFDKKVNSVEFVELPNAQYEIIQVDADNRKSESVNQELIEKSSSITAEQKIVIIKVAGELTSGKTADIDISALREDLRTRGALVVNISKNNLTSKEYTISEAKGTNREEIESNVFSENIGQLRFENQNLLNENGIALAKKLLQELSQPQLANEKKNEYIPRIRDNALKILGIDKDDS